MTGRTPVPNPFSSLVAIPLPVVAVLLLVLCPAAPPFPQETGAVGPVDILRIRTFPPEAVVSAEGVPLDGTRRGEGWREYPVPPGVTSVDLTAGGYEDRRLYLHGLSGTVELEERLLPAGGPLRLRAEYPTGRGPKSVVFLPGGRLLVPLLNGPGVELFRVLEDDPLAGLTGLGLSEPGLSEPGEESRAGGRNDRPERGSFVEPLVLPHRGQIWVSEMEHHGIHRFDLEDGDWLGALPSGGRWPKVLISDRREERIYVANWASEDVAVMDAESGAVLRRIPVGGQPRGLALTDDDRYLWVCIFSTGEIEIVDTVAGTVVERLGLPPGAARHILVAPGGDTLYYSDMFHGSVGIIDRESRQVVASRRVGPNVNSIALHPDGRHLYVSVRGRNNRESYLLPGPEHGRIVVLDARTLTTVQTIWGRRQPTGLAVAPDGKFLAATDFLDDNLVLYSIDP